MRSSAPAHVAMTWWTPGIYILLFFLTQYDCQGGADPSVAHEVGGAFKLVKFLFNQV